MFMLRIFETEADMKHLNFGREIYSFYSPLTLLKFKVFFIQKKKGHIQIGKR